MQNSQLYRRGFVTPLDSGALLALRANDVSEATAVEYAEIGTQEDFEVLWSEGFFPQLRQRTAIEIDDYEEAEIPPALVGELRCIAAQFATDASLPETARSFCRAVSMLSASAERSGMPVFAIL